MARSYSKKTGLSLIDGYKVLNKSKKKDEAWRTFFGTKIKEAIDNVKKEKKIKLQNVDLKKREAEFILRDKASKFGEKLGNYVHVGFSFVFNGCKNLIKTLVFIRTTHFAYYFIRACFLGKREKNNA
jgi:hypothetical protein